MDFDAEVVSEGDKGRVKNLPIDLDDAATEAMRFFQKIRCIARMAAEMAAGEARL